MNLKRAQLNSERSHRRHAAKQDRCSHQRIAYAPPCRDIDKSPFHGRQYRPHARASEPNRFACPIQISVMICLYNRAIRRKKQSEAQCIACKRKGDCPRNAGFPITIRHYQGTCRKENKKDVGRYRSSRCVRADANISPACRCDSSDSTASPPPANSATSSREPATDAFPYAR